jgi:hypothetical protein
MVLTALQKTAAIVAVRGRGPVNCVTKEEGRLDALLPGLLEDDSALRIAPVESI